MTDAGSVVGLLHLAQAAAAAGEWAEVETIVEHEAMLTSADADFIAACSPSVVVALVERLQRAEDAAVLLAANLAEACDALEDSTAGHVSGYEPDILNWREMAAAVSGLQEPTKADEHGVDARSSDQEKRETGFAKALVRGREHESNARNVAAASGEPTKEQQ